MDSPRPVDRPHVLLTGASGVLGSVVAAELAPHAQVTCLTRRRPVSLTGIRSVAGDLTQTGLGLTGRDLAEVLARTDVVVHCGALTAFTIEGGGPERVNGEGTQRILDLVARADARLVHVSTAFVERAGAYEDPAPGQADVPVRTPQHYLRSKIAGERAVLDSGLPVAVVRPSVLIGDSATGAISQFQGWHQLCAGILSGSLPFLPTDGAALIDCVPVDLAARAVAGLAIGAGAGAPDRGEWWLTAGADALSVDPIIDLCLDVAADRGLAPDRPRLLPREMVQRLVLPAFGQSAPPRLLTQMLEGLELMRLFGSDRPFPRRWPAVPGAEEPDAPLLEASVRNSLDYLADTLDLGAREAVA